MTNTLIGGWQQAVQEAMNSEAGKCLSKAFESISKPTPVFEALILRERMKSALVEAVGPNRAEELLPAERATIKVRRPVKYQSSGWMV